MKAETGKTQKVATEVAQAMLDTWFEMKRIKEKKRTRNEGSEDVLLEAISDGLLSIDEKTGELVQKMIHPYDAGSLKIDKLTYFPRLKVKELNIKLKGIRGDDADGRILAYAAALTTQNKGVIDNLDIADYTITQSIVVYFL